jgi:hypothetical protein
MNMNRIAIEKIVRLFTALTGGIEFEQHCDRVQALSSINSSVRLYFACFEDMQAYYSDKELSLSNSDTVKCNEKGYLYLKK